MSNARFAVNGPDLAQPRAESDESSRRDEQTVSQSAIAAKLLMYQGCSICWYVVDADDRALACCTPTTRDPSTSLLARADETPGLTATAQMLSAQKLAGNTLDCTRWTATENLISSATCCSPPCVRGIDTRRFTLAVQWLRDIVQVRSGRHAQAPVVYHCVRIFRSSEQADREQAADCLCCCQVAR